MLYEISESLTVPHWEGDGFRAYRGDMISKMSVPVFSRVRCSGMVSNTGPLALESDVLPGPAF